MTSIDEKLSRLELAYAKAVDSKKSWRDLSLMLVLLCGFVSYFLYDQIQTSGLREAALHASHAEYVKKTVASNQDLTKRFEDQTAYLKKQLTATESRVCLPEIKPAQTKVEGFFKDIF